MPAGLVLHEGNAFSFDGLHHDSHGHAFDGLCLLKGALQLVEIVSVSYGDYMEIESLEFLVDGVGGADVS